MVYLTSVAETRLSQLSEKMKGRKYRKGLTRAGERKENRVTNSRETTRRRINTNIQSTEL